MVTYKQAAAYLEEIPYFTKKNTPEKTAEFYKYVTKHLPLPQRTKVIHVAGTNGKGSVCAYLQGILMAAGFTTGMFISPHLVEIRERFHLDRELVSEEEFAAGYEKIRQLVDTWRAEQDPEYHPAYFEFLFFMLFPILQNHPVDYLILETGLGGRLDATNQIPNPAVCVITKIGLDHMQYLGNTIPEIAGEKAGIIKPGVPVVYLDARQQASTVIRQKASELGARAYSVSKRDYAILSFDHKTIDFSYTSRYYGYVEVHLDTTAFYQMENASLAIETIGVLDEGTYITREQIQQGLWQTHWEGRMEEILPGVILDGGHNEDGIQAFLETVRQDGCKGKRTLLFAAVSDKRARQMVELLLKEDLFSCIRLVPLETSRRIETEQLLELTRNFQRGTAGNAAAAATATGADNAAGAGNAAWADITAAENLETAFLDAVTHRSEDDRVYIVGSLYLAGQIKELLSHAWREITHD